MIRRPPRSTQSRSSAASDVYKRQAVDKATPTPVLSAIPTAIGTNATIVPTEVPTEIAIKHAITNSPAIKRFLGNIEIPRFTVDSTAVSYTHLRAHETVLDLVCRLLLEKKKNKKIKNKKTNRTNTNIT